MKINLEKAGKRYNSEWVYRAFSFEFTSGYKYAITGPNGSGKSTLLQSIGGSTLINEGSITYTNNQNKLIPDSSVFKYISIAAPYLELVEEMSLLEFLQLHHQLKGWRPDLDTKSIISILGLTHATQKQVRYFSSGMKQRVKLAQAIFSDVEVILLDEPNTNLDLDGIALYHSLVKDYCAEKLVIVSSNDKNEYDFCEHIIDINQYK